MSIVNYISSIASSLNKRKKSTKKMQPITENHPIYTCSKEQHLKWLSEGKCQCCGRKEGKFKGICDECRWS